MLRALRACRTRFGQKRPRAGTLPMAEEQRQFGQEVLDMVQLEWAMQDSVRCRDASVRRARSMTYSGGSKPNVSPRWSGRCNGVQESHRPAPVTCVGPGQDPSPEKFKGPTIMPIEVNLAQVGHHLLQPLDLAFRLRPSRLHLSVAANSVVFNMGTAPAQAHPHPSLAPMLLQIGVANF